jgi:hypothetical protein
MIVKSQQQPDGTIEPLDDWPMPCAVCGEIPEMLIEFMGLPPFEATAEGKFDDLRAAAGQSDFASYTGGRLTESGRVNRLAPS